jgi:hypothetical protein
MDIDIDPELVDLQVDPMPMPLGSDDLNFIEDLDGSVNMFFHC